MATMPAISNSCTPADIVVAFHHAALFSPSIFTLAMALKQGYRFIFIAEASIMLLKLCEFSSFVCFVFSKHQRYLKNYSKLCWQQILSNGWNLCKRMEFARSDGICAITIQKTVQTDKIWSIG
jgi:hypothetical protein